MQQNKPAPAGKVPEKGTAPVTAPAAVAAPAAPKVEAAKAAPASGGTQPAPPVKKAAPAAPATAPAAVAAPAAKEQAFPLKMPFAVSRSSLDKNLQMLSCVGRWLFLPAKRAQRMIFLLVLLPGVLVFLYLMLFASDMYISEARFALRGQNSAPGIDAIGSLFRVPTSTQNDSYIILNYIESLDMYTKLDESLHLKEHYTDTSRDIWFRLTANPTQDEIQRYWQWVTSISYDPDTGILSVEVKAFSAEMAKKICNGILENSEALVNTMNQRARSDAISQAALEVKRAEERIRKAQEAMRLYRERTIILDPQAVATGLYGVVNELEASATKTAAELAESLTFMKSDSPRVIQLRNRLEVLQKQLETEKKRLAGDLKQDKPLSALVSEFQSLTLEEEFAQKQLTSAMTSLETARVQADAQTLYIEAFERPILPDESLYPRPVYFTFIFMLTALLLLGLVSLIIAAVREHAGF